MAPGKIVTGMIGMLVLVIPLIVAGCTATGGTPGSAPGVPPGEKSGIVPGILPGGSPGGTPGVPPGETPMVLPGAKPEERISAHPTPPDGVMEVPMKMPSSGKPTAYQTVLQAAALASANPEPLTLAFRLGESGLEIPADLPAELLQALEGIDKAGDGGLYLLIYGGEMPSGGFSIEIDSIHVEGEPSQAGMNVAWRIVPPGADRGAIAALTYPYLLVRVESAVEASEVVFERVGK